VLEQFRELKTAATSAPARSGQIDLADVLVELDQLEVIAIISSAMISRMTSRAVSLSRIGDRPRRGSDRADRQAASPFERNVAVRRREG
jgi:hypothetical protein